MRSILATFAAICALSLSAAPTRSMVAGRHIAGGAKLPYDAEVEYLQTDGAALIDCGFAVSQDAQVDIMFGRSSRSILLDSGAQTGWQANVIRVVMLPNTSVYWQYGASTSTYGIGADSDFVGNVRVEISGKKLTLSNITSGFVKTSTSSGTVPFMTGGNYCLFGFGIVDGYVIENRTNGLRIYSADIHDGDNHVVFIPVRFTNEQGMSEGAMYDRVSGQLFRNQGTGAFTYGGDK